MHTWKAADSLFYYETLFPEAWVIAFNCSVQNKRSNLYH